MSHGAELLFASCWILPFPWYFPSSSRRSRRDTDTGQGSAGTQGTGTALGRGTTWLQIQLPKQQVFFTSAPQAYTVAEMNLERKRQAPLHTPTSLNVPLFELLRWKLWDQTPPSVFSHQSRPSQASPRNREQPQANYVCS